MALDEDVLEDGIGFCLSGGGYRAMVFHLGSLMRLNEAALLPHISRISSVSGGSITAAYLGLRWKDLQFDQQGRAQALHLVNDKIRQMVRTNIDAGHHRRNPAAWIDQRPRRGSLWQCVVRKSYARRAA
jgi:predicted acylesterase/phospholipase RssA